MDYWFLKDQGLDFFFVVYDECIVEIFEVNGGVVQDKVRKEENVW